MLVRHIRSSFRVVLIEPTEKELVYELAEYLSQRYPSSFKVTRLPSNSRVPTLCGISLSWDEKMPVRTIRVVETGAEYDLGVLETLDGIPMGEEALRIVNGLQVYLSIPERAMETDAVFQAHRMTLQS